MSMHFCYQMSTQFCLIFVISIINNSVCNFCSLICFNASKIKLKLYTHFWDIIFVTDIEGKQPKTVNSYLSATTKNGEKLYTQFLLSL